MSTIISKRENFIFLHIAKAAGTSVTSVLEPYADRPILNSKLVRNTVHIAGHWLGVNLMQYTGQYILPLHASASVLEKRCPDLVFDSFFKFAFVRNPWDRMVSLYFFSKMKRKRYTHPKKYNESIDLGFADFIEKICVDACGLSQADCLFKDADGNPNMDFIGKVENMERDMCVVLKRIGLPNVLSPHLNASKHAHYTTFYNEYTRSLVEQSCARDIELFGYRFGI